MITLEFMVAEQMYDSGWLEQLLRVHTFIYKQETESTLGTTQEF